MKTEQNKAERNADQLFSSCKYRQQVLNIVDSAEILREFLETGTPFPMLFSDVKKLYGIHKNYWVLRNIIQGYRVEFNDAGLFLEMGKLRFSPKSVVLTAMLLKDHESGIAKKVRENLVIATITPSQHEQKPDNFSLFLHTMRQKTENTIEEMSGLVRFLKKHEVELQYIRHVQEAAAEIKLLLSRIENLASMDFKK